MTVKSSICPGLRDQCSEQKTGLLFRTDTDAAESHASAMELCLEDPVQKKMNRIARRYAASFSWDRAAKKHCASFSASRGEVKPKGNRRSFSRSSAR